MPTYHPYARLFPVNSIPPTASDDSSAGYEAGDFWHVTGGDLYVCRNASVGAAVWDNITATMFNDAEGDPADVTTGSAADGTSDYAARRDHVHHIELTAVGQYRQFVTIGDGAGGWDFVTFDGEPLMILQDLE